MTRTILTAGLAALLIGLLAAAPADAKPQVCDFQCTYSTCASISCTDPSTGQVITCQTWGVYDYSDPDCDGLDNPQDNCDYVANSNQADCDGDGTGDVCDSENANYQYVSSSARICYIDGYNFYDGDWDNSQVYAFWEAKYVDVSSCGAPDDWRSLGNETHWCYDEPFVYGCCVFWFSYQCSQHYKLYSCQF